MDCLTKVDLLELLTSHSHEANIFIRSTSTIPIVPILLQKEDDSF